MTRDEAVKWFKESSFYHEKHEPFNMAIEALTNWEPVVRCENCDRCDKVATTTEIIYFCKNTRARIDKRGYCNNGKNK